MYNLDGKIVLITGAAGGIGASVVRDFLKEGVKHITFLDINESAGKQLEEELKVLYNDAKVRFLKCDITKEDELFGAFDVVTKDQGYIDVVINNAGLSSEHTPQAVRREVEVNYLALVNSTIKAIELMRIDRGSQGGTVINISSIGALCRLSPSFFVYSGTKSAILHFSTCIGNPEYASKTGVRVITICFGGTDTRLLRDIRGIDEIVKEHYQRNSSLFSRQSVEEASKGLLEAYKKGKTGSTWLVSKNKVLDYTATVERAYKILSEELYT